VFATCWSTYQECEVPFQRAAAAFFAISDRCSAVSFAALAAPPFAPPSRPSATAAGFFPASGSGAFPVASSTTEAASRFKSVGRFLGRSGMNPWYSLGFRREFRRVTKLTHYPPPAQLDLEPPDR